MKKSLWACILLTLFLFGCGGGGGTPGTGSGGQSNSGTGTGTGTGTGNAIPGLFTKSGTGDTVFELPANVTRIRIQGTYTANSSNFIVKIAGSNIVNEILGNAQNAVAFDGVYLLAGGGTVEITKSSGVSWTFTEVKADSSLIPAGLFTKVGTGDTVFDIPARVTRIRIQGTYTANSSNFIVKIAGKSGLVNEILGTSQNRTVFEGTYVIAGGGTVEITRSSGVSWRFTEVQ